MSWVAWKLLLQWMEYLLLQLPMLSQDVTLLSYIRVFPSIWSEKTVFQLVSFKNTCVYSFLWIAIHWVCRIDTNRSDKISMHRDAPVNRYTPTNDTICRHRSGSTFAQIMACCLRALSHYLNQRWHVISKVQWYSREYNFIRYASTTNL